MGAATLEDEMVMRNESELLSRQILDRALDGVVNLDQQGKITYWNAESERIFGYSCFENDFQCGLLFSFSQYYYDKPETSGSPDRLY